MSVLSDEQLMDIARPACGNFHWPSTALDIMRAAIAADRAARAEPVVPDGWLELVEEVSRMGLHKDTFGVVEVCMCSRCDLVKRCRAMLAAANAPRQEPTT